MKTLYTASAHTVGGRTGHVETADGFLKFDLSMPKGMGGQEKPNTTNPEQLFACGYSACFGSALDFVAKQKKLELKTIGVGADVSIGLDEKNSLGLSVVLKIYLPELSAEEAQQLAEAAHQVCPYSKATRNNIDVKLTIVDKL